MKRHKPEVITFKADVGLIRALKGVSNRSEFIRGALLAALENTCPLCRGSGALTANQRQHWDAFAAGHSVVECDKCHEVHLICEIDPGKRKR